VSATLGFVGLGVIGGRMAKRLLDAGHAVVGYNRTRAKAQWLLDAGLRPASSPRAAAEAADVVFSMVTDSEALEAVTRGPDGILAGLRRGVVYVVSTVDPEATRVPGRKSRWSTTEGFWRSCPRWPSRSDMPRAC
jgi:3-hydroxyisobutyrate dehydrogenase-like beta-hydroxyacid dehydrogenase